MITAFQMSAFLRSPHLVQLRQKLESFLHAWPSSSRCRDMCNNKPNFDVVKVLESFLQQEQNLMTTDVSTGIMKRTQMCALNAPLKERRSRRASSGAVSFNNSTLYSKETRRRLSDPAACIMRRFNLFNWVLNFLYEAWHPPHASPSWKWIRPFSSSLNFICFTSSLCFSMSSLITRKKQAHYEARKWKTSQKSLIIRTNYFKLRNSTL